MAKNDSFYVVHREQEVRSARNQIMHLVDAGSKLRSSMSGGLPGVVFQSSKPSGISIIKCIGDGKRTKVIMLDFTRKS